MKFLRFINALLLILSGTFFSAQCLSSEVPSLFYRPEGSEIEIYSKKKDLSLIVYPAKSKRLRGSVIFIHGGGFQNAGPDMPLYSDWEKLLDKYNLQGFSIEHRTSPSFRGKDLIEDCMDAVNYIRKNAKRFHIPDDRIALIGFSSGGYLAVMTGIEMNRIKQNSILSVVAFYPPLDLEEILKNGSPQMKKYLRDFLPIKHSAVQDEQVIYDFNNLIPQENVHISMPKTLILHGDMDKLISSEQSKKYFQYMNKKIQGRIQLDLIPGAAHNFNLERNRSVRAAERKAARFIARSMRFRKIKDRWNTIRNKDEDLFLDDSL